MKKIVLFGIVILLSVNLSAKEQITKNDAIEEICSGVAEYAKIAMDGRQNGVSLIAAIKIVNDTIQSKPQQSYYKSITYQAYEESAWATSEYKQKAITEFSNKKFLECSKIFNAELKDI